MDIQTELLKRFAKQHGVEIPKRPSFTWVLRYAIGGAEGRSRFGIHTTELLSAIAHSVPDTMVGLSMSPSNDRWRPGHIGFIDVDRVALINLVRAVLFSYFRAVNRQIKAYGWDKSGWQAWGEHVDELLEKGRGYVGFTLADRRLARRSSGPWETILGPDPIDPGPVTEKTIERWGVEAMEDAGIDPAKIHAWRKTGLLVSDLNMHLLSDEDIAEWTDAVEEYRTEHPEEYEGRSFEARDTNAEE